MLWAGQTPEFGRCDFRTFRQQKLRNKDDDITKPAGPVSRMAALLVLNISTTLCTYNKVTLLTVSMVLKCQMNCRVWMHVFRNVMALTTVDCCKNLGGKYWFCLRFYLEFRDTTFALILGENVLLIHHLNKRGGIHIM